MLTSTLGGGRLEFGVFRSWTDERELREFVRANLAHLKPPHTVTFVENLPKPATGKLQKYILRASHD
jgi:acyl-coenzyme A synthetase/AMP-(fatty) acid ligase